jgi:hypothetical protein
MYTLQKKIGKGFFGFFNFGKDSKVADETTEATGQTSTSEM